MNDVRNRKLELMQFRDSKYALWLSGTEIDEPRGWANLTEWFVVKGGNTDLNQQNPDLK